MAFTVKIEPLELARGLVVALLVAGVGVGAWESYRTRTELEAIAATQTAAASSAAAAQKARQDAALRERQTCSKAESGLDHDVDMGALAPCPTPGQGYCLTVNGQTMTARRALQLCQEGKL